MTCFFPFTKHNSRKKKLPKILYIWVHKQWKNKFIKSKMYFVHAELSCFQTYTDIKFDAMSLSVILGGHQSAKLFINRFHGPL